MPHTPRQVEPLTPEPTEGVAPPSLSSPPRRRTRAVAPVRPGPSVPPTPATAVSVSPTGRTVKVRATRLGYFDHIRRRPGDVFTIPIMPSVDGDAAGPYGRWFSERWMEVVPARTPESITTPAQALKQTHDDILGTRSGTTRASDSSVLG